VREKLITGTRARDLVNEDRKRVIASLKRAKLYAYLLLIQLVTIPPFLVLYFGESNLIDFGCYSSASSGSITVQSSCSKVRDKVYNTALITFLIMFLLAAGVNFFIINNLIFEINVELHDKLLQPGMYELNSKFSKK
jgi:hypothetical protein